MQIGIFECTGIMGQDLVHPYIQSTTVLCDIMGVPLLLFTHKLYTSVDPGLMKGGFSGNPKILAMGVLTTENGAVVHEVSHLGGSVGMPPRKILDSVIIFGAIWK